jgi:stage III sporulation protein AC
MDLELIMKVAGMGMVVSVACQILSKIGKDDYSSLVSLGGIVAILVVLFGEIGALFDTVRGIFGI